MMMKMSVFMIMMKRVTMKTIIIETTITTVVMMITQGKGVGMG